MRIINSFDRQVAVFGAQHLSDKDLQVIQLIINLPEFSDAGSWLHSIVIRKDGFYPMANLLEKEEVKERAFGSAAFDHKSVAINLFDIFDEALEAAERNRFSIVGYYYQLIWDTMLHECKHLYDIALKPETVKGLTSPELRIDLEAAADNFARERLYELAKEYDLEPSVLLEESPYLAEMMHQLLGDLEIQTEFVRYQRDLIARGFYYYRRIDEETVHKLATFKDFLHNMAGDPKNEPTWNKCTRALPEVISMVAGVNLPQPAQDTTMRTWETIPQATMVGGVNLPQPVQNNVQSVEADLPPWEEPEAKFSQPMVDYTQPESSVYGQFAQPAPEPVYHQPAPTAPVNFAPQQVPEPVYHQPAPQQLNPVPQGPMQQYAGTQHKGEVEVNIGELPESARWIINVYYKIYDRIFGDKPGCCGVVNMAGCDPTVDYQPFTNNAAINTPIMLEPQEQAMVVGCDHQFKGTFTDSSNGITGYEFKNTKLPAYRIHIKGPDGTVRIRQFFPQNPNKRVGDKLSSQSEKARNGACILYIKDGYDAKNHAILFKIIDKKLYKCGQ